MHACRKLSVLFFVLALLIVCSAEAASPDSIDGLRAKLRSSDRVIRSRVVVELGRIKNDETFGLLMAIVENKNEDWKIQILAIRLLSETKDLRAAELIMNVLQYPFFTNDCPALKWNAAIALGNFGNERRIVNTLIDTLHDRDLYVREASIQSLGKIGNADAVPHLISALSDSSFAIKLSAINALGKIGSPAAIPYLRRIVDNDGDEYIKNEALSALKRLELK